MFTICVGTLYLKFRARKPFKSCLSACAQTFGSTLIKILICMKLFLTRKVQEHSMFLVEDRVFAFILVVPMLH